MVNNFFSARQDLLRTSPPPSPWVFSVVAIVTDRKCAYEVNGPDGYVENINLAHIVKYLNTRRVCLKTLEHQASKYILRIKLKIKKIFQLCRHPYTITVKLSKICS